MDIFEELGVPKKYLKPTTKEGHYIALVHKSWLKSLVKYSKLVEFAERGRFDAWPVSEEELGASWSKVFICVFKKRDASVIPLPRIRSLIKDDPPLLFCQLMQYIYQTNYKNLWKEAYKKYNSKTETSKETQISLVEYNEVLREILTRIYGCPLVNICDSRLSTEQSKNFDVHLNVLPAVCAVETLNAIFVLHMPYFDHSLKDCVTFSPAILNKCYAKPLFIIYQLLQTLKSMHDRSLTLGDISLSDIYLTEDMWIYIIPNIHSNIYVQETKTEAKRHVNIPDCRKNGHKFDLNLKCEGCGIKTYDKVQISNETLQELCQLWVEGQISNFTYISALNKLSGRKLGDPNCHHVFPWVTDFASRCGKNWRDLKKSKFRLNKGDRQLDLTYENASSEVPHHVSDVLSSITYYVYMARRTPKSVLCKNVRTIWVPAEYPSSIQRMQEWTPDECIPEFFTDPTVFKSIHDDLDDLEVPSWCTGPEDFVEKHREALESVHVSERLHYWIDLTFGYKLAGAAAVKAKNVCLHLVDDHTKLMKSGIVQLFTHPHPPKATPSPFWNKTPPKIYISKTKPKSRDRSNSPGLTLDAKTDDEDIEDIPASSNRPLGLSRFLSRSRSSLNEEKPKNATRSSSSGPKNAFTSHLKVQSSSLTTGVIYLPKEYRPEQYLENLEKKHAFFAKTFHLEEKRVKCVEEKRLEEHANDECLVQNAFTNLIFSENFEKRLQQQDNLNFHRSRVQKNENQIICNYSDIISARRIRELQILGCLIVEIFMSKQLRALGANDSNLSFTDRLKACLTVIKSSEIPPCISYVVHLLLQPDTPNFKEFKYPSVTDLGLPPPSAHLLLEPLLHSVIPFPRLFPYLYSLIATLKDFKNVSTELGVLYHFDCNGEMCAEYESLERTKVLFAQNIGECKVKSCARNLESLLEELNTTTDLEVANILLPHVRELIEDPPTSVLAAWYLFDPLARVLGPQKTAGSLLEPILKLYENEPTEATLPYYGKIAKLYHHSFLLRLIVRLGLKCFLDNLVAPLVEAVGRYKDYEKVDFILHTHSEKFVRKTSHLKTMDAEHVDTSGSDDSSVSSEKRPTPRQELASEPEVFDFDDDKQNEEQLKSLMEHLELNVASDLPFNHSTAEEALDATLTENLDQLRSLEELTMNLSEDDVETRPGVSSPTIPIPSTKQEFSNISCEVGSKKSDSIQLDLVLDSPGSAVSDQKKPTSVAKAKKQDAKISDMSSDSLVWLSHRLGPVLTARYLSRNLLKMLTLCYVGKENLTLVQKEENSREVETLSVVSSYVLGDQNAVKVLECLTSIAGLYGEQLILFQYIPHMSELIALCKRRLTANLEGGLISCLALFQHVIPYLSDSTLMDQLQDVILKNILHPIVRLLASTKYTFPSGYTARNILARKYLDTLYVLSIRMGSDMTRTHLAVPALQRFFLIFDKVFSGEESHQPEDSQVSQSEKEESHYVELCRDGSVNEWSVGGKPIQISRMNDTDSGLLLEDASEQSLEELRLVFTTELAYTAYLPFLRHIGANSLEISLKNHSLIKELCQEYEQGAKSSVPITNKSADFKSTISASSSIGSNIALVGNRIDVQTADLENFNTDLLSLVSNRLENNSRHLRGNWLAYWEHEIGRSDKDTMFNFKQIKLQTFAGHTHSVKCLYVLDNENSFISGSRDKTVKLWSLRSQGDGSSVSTCQWTYTAHKKSVLSLTFIESMRLVASCDSVVHIWDPFMGANVGHLESPRYPPVNVLRSLPAPSSLVFAATTDGTVKVIDTRVCNYIHELKVSLSPTGLIRCLAVAPSGAWVATGQSSGTITVLDTRTGLVISTWKAHESEVLQLVAADNSTLISSSLDQTIGVWNASDGKFKFHLRSSFIRGATEPVHCLNVYNNELISGTTANRIGVHTSIDMEASFSSTKLRSDAFRGLLTSMALLPLNRLLLLGADTGTINLLC